MNITVRTTLVPTLLLLVATPALASWQLSTVANTDVSHVSQNLYVSSGGSQTQRIVYRSTSAGLLRLATRSNPGSGWGAWSIRNVDTNSATHNAIAVSSLGQVFIAYHDTTNRDLYLTWYNACFFPSCTPSWPKVRIDGASDAADYGLHVSLTLVEDANGNVSSIHAASIRDPDSGASTVRHTGCMHWPSCTSTANWSSQDAPLSNVAGYHTGITGRIDSAGNTNVDIFVGVTNGWGPGTGTYRIGWGSIAGGVWGTASSLTNIAGNLSVKKVPGGPTIVTLGTNTQTYYGASPNYVFTRVSADGQGGPEADAIIDELGIPVVAFFRNITDDLLIARLVNGTWIREVVVTAEVVGHNAQIAQDIDGDLLIPYRNATTDRLMLAMGY